MSWQNKNIIMPQKKNLENGKYEVERALNEN